MSSIFLTLGRFMLLMESLLLSITVWCSHSAWSKCSVSVYQHPQFLPAGRFPTLDLFKIRLTVPLVYRPTLLILSLLKFLVIFSIERFLNIYQHTILYLIVSMDSAENDPLAICWHSSLNLSHLLLGALVKLCCCLRNIKKVLMVWYKSLTSKLLFCCFYPILCIFISSFLSGRSPTLVKDCYCYSSKAIDSGIPKGSGPSSTLCYSNMISVKFVC